MSEEVITRPPQRAEQNSQALAELADERQRMAYFSRLLLVLAIAAGGTIGFYVVLYVQTGAWQMLAAAGFLVLPLALTPVAYGLARRGNLDVAAFLTFLGVTVVYGSMELVWSGGTLYHAAGGILLIILVGSAVLPRKWIVWLATAGLFGVYVWLVNQFEPLPRYDVTQLTILNITTPGVTGLLALVILWQILRAYRRTTTIRVRLLTFFVMLVLVPAAIISVGAIARGALSAQQQVQAQLESVAVLKEAEINTWIDTLQTDLVVLLASEDMAWRLPFVLQGTPNVTLFGTTHDILQRYFQQMIEDTRRFDELFLMDLEGKTVLSTDPTQEGKDIHGIYPYFREGLKRPHVEPPYYSTTLGRTTITVSQPVVDAQGQVIGVLAGHANLTTLDEIMGERTGLGDTGETYLVGARHILWTTNRYGEKDIYVSTDSVNRAIETHGDGSGSYANYRGESVIGAYRWLEKLQVQDERRDDGVVLLAEQTQAEAFGPLYLTLGMIAVIALISVGVAAGVSLAVTRSIATPLADLAETATQIAAGDLDRVAEVIREDEVGALARSFNSMTAQLRDLISSLEQRVADRTRELEQRSTYLEAAAEVGHVATSILETDELFRRVVELIRERFGLYYVGLFLVDETGEWAVLRAGTGEAGRVMLTRGHRRRVGEGMIGWSIANAQTRIALDVGEDAVHLATAELPNTRSEAALPLSSRGQVLGALTVQSDQPRAFDPDTVVLLQTMADQVAVALDNARLFAESQEALETTRRAYGELSRAAWAELLGARPDLGYRSDERGVIEASHIWRPEMEQSLRTGQIVQSSASPKSDDIDTDERQPLAVPIKVGGDVIGVLDTYKPGDTGTWTREEIDLLQAMADQLGLALDSARLYRDSQHRAIRERLTGEITRRMRETLDVDTVLKTAADEIYQALNLDEIVIRLTAKEPTSIAGVVASLPLLPGKQLCAGRDMADAITLALEEANYRVGDFLVKLEIWDNSGPNDDIWRPESETSNAERAVTDPDVLIYLGPSTSSACKVSAPILNSAGLAQICPGATYPGLTRPGFEAGEPGVYCPSGKRTLFRLPTTDDLQGPAGAFWAQDLGLKRVYIIEQDDTYGHELVRAFNQVVGPAGLTVVGTSVVADGQITGLDEIAAAVAAQQPDLVYYTGFETTGIPLIKALRAKGVTASLIGADGLHVSAVVEDLRADAEGIMATFPGVSVLDLGGAGQNFARRFQGRFGYDPSGWTALAYDGACIALAAIKRAGKVDRAAVIEALHEIEFEGLAGHWSFDENGDAGLPLISGVRVKDGKWQSSGPLRVR